MQGLLIRAERCPVRLLGVEPSVRTDERTAANPPAQRGSLCGTTCMQAHSLGLCGTGQLLDFVIGSHKNTLNVHVCQRKAVQGNVVEGFAFLMIRRVATLTIALRVRHYLQDPICKVTSLIAPSRN